jgi:hypothetical protein
MLKSILILVVFLVIHFAKVVMFFINSITLKPREFLIDAVAENLIIYSAISDVLVLLFIDTDIRNKTINITKDN